MVFLFRTCQSFCIFYSLNIWTYSYIYYNDVFLCECTSTSAIIYIFKDNISLDICIKNNWVPFMKIFFYCLLLLRICWLYNYIVFTYPTKYECAVLFNQEVILVYCTWNVHDFFFFLIIYRFFFLYIVRCNRCYIV